MKKGLLALFCCVFAFSVGCQQTSKKKKEPKKSSRKSRYEMVQQIFNR